MDTLEFLVEEPSMASVLRHLLPKILPDIWQLDQNCFIRVHEGKQDLQRSLPKKIRAARNKHGYSYFVVVQDQDSNDCRVLKRELVRICEEARGGADNVLILVRIVCHELESWYLGDQNALLAVFPELNRQGFFGKARLRNPDVYVNPKMELRKRIGDYPQIETARLFASIMTVDNNRSRSFHCFVEGVKKIANNNR